MAHSSFLDDDELVGWFYKGFQGYRPFRREDSMSFDLKSASLHSESRLVKRLRPNLVSVGGDWLDFLGAIGRTDLIVEGMSRWRSWCDSWGGSLLLTTYTGSLTLEGALEKVLPMLDGLLVTVNRSGNGMFPTRQAFLDWVVGCKKPIMAMHAMEIGRIPVTEALRYIFEESPACSAVLGASRPATILQLCEGLADQFST
ncbi:MAG TPA: hypothetical protein VG944_16115 [Fimbriimonas sp.]|nr:hypothetical protein [Fimbriimonas sp.]